MSSSKPIDYLLERNRITARHSIKTRRAGSDKPLRATQYHRRRRPATLLRKKDEESRRSLQGRNVRAAQSRCRPVYSNATPCDARLLIFTIEVKFYSFFKFQFKIQGRCQNKFRKTERRRKENLRKTIHTVFDTGVCQFVYNDVSAPPSLPLTNSVSSSRYSEDAHARKRRQSTHAQTDPTRHGIGESIKYAPRVIWGRGSLFHPLSVAR